MYHAEDFVCLTKRIVRTYHSYGRKKLLLAVTAVYKFITGKSVTIVFQFCDHHSFVYHYLMLFLIIQTLICFLLSLITGIFYSLGSCSAT